MERICSLWINKTKDGVTYLSGEWTSYPKPVKVLIFKNDKKRPGSKDPDYTFMLAPIEPKEKLAPKEESDDF